MYIVCQIWLILMINGINLCILNDTIHKVFNRVLVVSGKFVAVIKVLLSENYIKVLLYLLVIVNDIRRISDQFLFIKMILKCKDTKYCNLCTNFLERYKTFLCDNVLLQQYFCAKLNWHPSTTTNWVYVVFHTR